MPIGRPMHPLTLSENDVRELQSIANSRSMMDVQRTKGHPERLGRGTCPII